MLTKICNASDISEGELYRIDVGSISFLVTRLGEKYVVTQASCSHEEADLTLGILMGKAVTCPLHQAKFDLETGSVLSGPEGEDPDSIKPLTVYRTKVEEGVLYADV